jgi:small-conductance mechanosensitive channel
VDASAWLAWFDSAEPVLQSSAFATVVWVILVVVVRMLAVRAIQRTEFATLEAKRRVLVAVRNTAVMLLVAGVVVLWAQEIESLLLSIVAIAAALVLATKELIMCVSGALLRTTTNAFHVGDRIEVNGVRGDVIDHSLLATTILEVGPGPHSHQATGRAVVVPNSLLLSHPIVNETFTDEYVLHLFTVAIGRDDDWAAAEKALLDGASAEVEPFLEEARTHLVQRASRHSLEPMSVDPRVSIRLNDPTRIELLVRVPVPARRKGRIEQAILRRFLAASGAGVDRSGGKPAQQRVEQVADAARSEHVG